MTQDDSLLSEHPQESTLRNASSGKLGSPLPLMGFQMSLSPRALLPAPEDDNSPGTSAQGLSSVLPTDFWMTVMQVTVPVLLVSPIFISPSYCPFLIPIY